MSTLRRLRRASCSSGVIWLRAGASLSPLPRLPSRLGAGLSSGIISTSVSSKSTESLLAALAGRPGRRPDGTLAAALVAVFLAAVFLTAAFLATAFFTAAFFAAAFLAGAFLAASADSALASAWTFTAVLAVLLVAAAVFLA